MKLRIAAFFVCTLTAVLLSSCSEDEINTNHEPTVDTSTFVYPFTNGSTWNYKRTFSAENIRPDSIRHYFTNWPFYSSGDVAILYDTLVNGIQTKCFLEKYVEVQESDTIIWYTRSYYANYDTAFVRIATRFSIGSFGLPDIAQENIRFEKSGVSFGSPSEITRFLETGNKLTGDDSLSMDIPPLRAMIYPISLNTEWIASYVQGAPWATKKYLSFNIVYVGNIPVSCVKIQRWIATFDDLTAYEYYSKHGLIKKDYLFTDILVTTIHHPNGVGYVDMRDKVEFTSFNIITPEQ